MNFSGDFQENILALQRAPNLSNDDFGADFCKSKVEKLRKAKDPLERSRLENVPVARAHRQGVANFGPKILYKKVLLWQKF